MANYLINFDLLHPAGGLELLEKEGFDILGGSVLQKDIYGTLTCEDLNQDVLDFLAKYRKSGFKYQVYKLPEGTATWHTGGGVSRSDMASLLAVASLSPQRRSPHSARLAIPQRN